MPAIAWLAVAVIAGAGAYRVGWPAWAAYRGRAAQETNTERYLAWRGRASRSPRGRPALTSDERWRVYTGLALGVIAALALVAFFLGS